MELTKFMCTKCGGHKATTGQLRAVGGFWTKLFNIQNLKFTTISCSACGFTEMYQDSKKRTAENILDFLTN